MRTARWGFYELGHCWVRAQAEQDRPGDVPAGRPMFEDAPVSVAAGWVARTLAPHLASLCVLPTDFAA